MGNGDLLEVEEAVDPDGYARLVLLGELDHFSSGGLLDRLGELKESGQPVRIDLSRLDFIDSSGVRTLIVTFRDARSDGWALEVDRQLSSQVQSVFDALGLDAVLWPPDAAGP